jgi:hypothetical protein
MLYLTNFKIHLLFFYILNIFLIKYAVRQYDKQDQQGKAAFNERNPHTRPGAQEDPKQK